MFYFQLHHSKESCGDAAKCCRGKKKKRGGVRAFGEEERWLCAEQKFRRSASGPRATARLIKKKVIGERCGNVEVSHFSAPHHTYTHKSRDWQHFISQYAVGNVNKNNNVKPPIRELDRKRKRKQHVWTCRAPQHTNAMREFMYMKCSATSKCFAAQWRNKAKGNGVTWRDARFFF